MNDRELGQLLNRYFNQKVQLKKGEKANALQVWEPVVRKVLTRVTQKDSRFKNQYFYGGSYYERTKTKAPNEFDLMVEIECSSLGKCKPYDLSTNPPTGFTTVKVDQGEEAYVWRRDGCLVNGLLSATQVKAVFSRLVNEAVRELGYSTIDHHMKNKQKTGNNLLRHDVKVKTNGPSVTLTITSQHFNSSIDLTLAIKDASWPDDAGYWKYTLRSSNMILQLMSLVIESGWPAQPLVTEIVNGGCHLVAKKPKGINSNDADLFWRYSFSQAEKKLFTGGSTGEPGTNRRKVLRILKSLKEDLYMTPLTSYHLKTIMFYEYEAYPSDTDWLTDKLAARFKSAVQRLKKCLQEKSCPHYFIPNLNLLDDSSFNAERYQYLIRKVDQMLHNPSQVIRP